MKEKMINYLRNNTTLAITISSVLMGFLIGAIVMLITGLNPIYGYQALFNGVLGSPRAVGELFVEAMPIILTGLAVGFAFKTGLFNIGAEGQLLMGGFAATAVALLFPLPAVILLPMVVISAAISGAIWAFIPGIIKAKLGVHEVVISIMLNYVAMYLQNFLLQFLPMVDSSRTEDINPNGSFANEFLEMISGGSRLHLGIFVVIIAIFIYWFILNKTKFGFELKSVGSNKNASEYAGMKVNRNIVLSMMISGAFAGVAGAIISNGIFNYGRMLFFQENYGFDGIAVALLGNNSALGIGLSGLLFGGLKAGSKAMALANVPKEISLIIMASIVIMTAMQLGLKILLERKLSEKEGE